MLVKDLREALHGVRPDLKVVVRLSDPSIGPCSSTEILNLHPGFDWNSGKLILDPADPIVHRKAKEHVWQMGLDFIYRLATDFVCRRKKNIGIVQCPTHVGKTARRILHRAGIQLPASFAYVEFDKTLEK